MVERKLVSFTTIVSLWTLVTLLIKLIRLPLIVETHTRHKLRQFGCYVAKAKLFCQKVSSRSPGLECSYGKIFCENRDLGNRAGPASHMNTSKFLRRKEWRDEISETEPPRLTGLT